jgi:hypothetical protein
VGVNHVSNATGSCSECWTQNDIYNGEFEIPRGKLFSTDIDEPGLDLLVKVKPFILRPGGYCEPNVKPGYFLHTEPILSGVIEINTCDANCRECQFGTENCTKCIDDKFVLVNGGKSSKCG